MKQIASAFVKAQKAFGPALKTSTNPHFKSRYADLSACIEAVIDALNDNGIAVQQHTTESDSGVIIETVFIHESGEVMNCGKLHIPASKHDAQGFGSAMSYARRYSLMASCGIAPEEDDGNAASKPVQKRDAPVIPARPVIELPEDELPFMQEMKEQVIEMCSTGQNIAALQYIQAAGLDNDQRIWLDNQLDSKIRSALKAAKQANFTRA